LWIFDDIEPGTTVAVRKEDKPSVKAVLEIGLKSITDLRCQPITDALSNRAFYLLKFRPSKGLKRTPKTETP